MDRFEKWAEYIMKHGDKILEKKKHRNMLIRRVSFSCASAFAAIIIVFFAWKSAPPKIEIPSDNIIYESSTVTNSTYTENTAPTTTSFTNTRYTSITNINKTLTTTVTTVPITTQTSITQKNTRVSVTTSILTSYADTEAHTHAVTSKLTQPITTKVQTTSAVPHIVTTTSAVVTQTSSKGGNAGFEYTTTSSKGDDMAFVHTTTSNGDDVYVHTTTHTVTTETVTTTTTDSGDNNVPPQPMNEKYPLTFLDGDITMYRNTYRISSDNVGDYIGTAGMRGQLSIYKAEAYEIKNIDKTIAIAIKFEEDEGYYLYRNNNTSIDTIKELISPEE